RYQRRRARGRGCPPQQQLLRKPDQAALLGGRGLAGGPLAVVLEVGPRSLGELEVLVGLLRLGGQLLEVVLKPRLVVAIGLVGRLGLGSLSLFGVGILDGWPHRSLGLTSGDLGLLAIG